jgi:hypothetical protein
LHYQWIDTVSDPARLVASDELRRRTQTGAYVLMLAVYAPSTEHVTYAVIRGALDVEEGAESLLRREDTQPPTDLPPLDEISD